MADRRSKTLTRLAELGERAGRVFTLENLNTAVDHPGTPFAKAADTLALVEAVDSPHLKLNLDLYHAQIGEGNLVQLVERALPSIGEIQVADVPGRCEPGTGEIHYPAVAAALHRLGYDGVVGLEGWASGDPERGARPLPRRLHRVPLSSGAAHGHTPVGQSRNAASNGTSRWTCLVAVMCVVPGSTASCEPGISSFIRAPCSTVTKSWSPITTSTGAVIPASCSSLQPSRVRDSSRP